MRFRVIEQIRDPLREWSRAQLRWFED